MNVLIIDDEPITAVNLKERLELNKFTVNTADNYDTALEKASYGNFDLIICDYFLSNINPKKQGTNLIKQIRSRGVKTPIILLTGRSVEEIAPWIALNSGADDFLQKPYNIQELVARITALIRRQFSGNAVNKVVKDNIEMDIISRETFINNKRVKLGNTLSLILLKLIQSKGDVLTYRELISYIWGDSSLYLSKTNGTLRVHMTNLKKKLGEKLASQIETINGIGYQFKN